MKLRKYVPYVVEYANHWACRNYKVTMGAFSIEWQLFNGSPVSD